MNSIPDFVTGYCQRHGLIDPLQDSDAQWWAYASRHDAMPSARIPSGFYQELGWPLNVDPAGFEQACKVMAQAGAALGESAKAFASAVDRVCSAFQPEPDWTEIAGQLAALSPPPRQTRRDKIYRELRRLWIQ